MGNIKNKKETGGQSFMVMTVIKRNGMEVTFDKNKISNAIKKAFYDTDNKTEAQRGQGNFLRLSSCKW